MTALRWEGFLANKRFPSQADHVVLCIADEDRAGWEIGDNESILCSVRKLLGRCEDGGWRFDGVLLEELDESLTDSRRGVATSGGFLDLADPGSVGGETAIGWDMAAHAVLLILGAGLRDFACGRSFLSRVGETAQEADRRGERHPDSHPSILPSQEGRVSHISVFLRALHA